jgi:Ca2+-binding EF-hand superfamily protein
MMDAEELGEILASTGRFYTMKSIQRAMDAISGVEGTTLITLDQFASLIFQKKAYATIPVAARHRLDQFDKEGTGILSLENLKNCTQRIDP